MTPADVGAEGRIEGRVRHYASLPQSSHMHSSIEADNAKRGPFLVIVHESDLRGADGLLGRDFLAGYDVTMDSKEQFVTLSR